MTDAPEPSEPSGRPPEIVTISPVAWEDPSRNRVARFLGTLREGLMPWESTSRLLVGGSPRPALGFAFLTVIPLAFLAGIIPYTQRLLFGPRFQVAGIDGPSEGEVLLDVLTAGGVGLLVHLAVFIALAAPFVSLTVAFGRTEDARSLALRTVLYRAWLLPLAGNGLGDGLVLSVFAWGAPAAEGAAVQVLLPIALFAALVPLLLFLFSMLTTASRLIGIPPLNAWALLLVPVLLMFMSQALLGEILAPFRPELEAPGSETPETTPPADRADPDAAGGTLT